MVKVEPDTNAEASNASEPVRRSPRRSASPQKPKRTIKLVKKRTTTPTNNDKNGKKVKKKSPKKEKDTEVKSEPPDPDAPLQMFIPTKTQKRRALRNNIVVEESDDVQDARRREKERLERLEKLRQNTTITAANYESVPSTSNLMLNFVGTENKKKEDIPDQCLVERRPSQENDTKEFNDQKIPATDEFSAFEDKNEDDEIILDCVVQKPQIEVVDLSSDDEDQNLNGRRLINAAYVKGMTDKKFTSPQVQEELRVRRLKRSEETLDKIEVNAEGLLLVNEGKPANDPDVFVSKHLTTILQPHQLGGIRFMYDNVIETIGGFNPDAGFGCILAHSMGLGKSIQVIAFTEIFFRVTPCKRALIICPINVIQNWQQEYDKWLPRQDGIRNFPVFLLGDLVKSQTARLELVSRWTQEGGILLLGYEMFRLLTIKRRRRKDKVEGEEASSSKDKKEISAEEASEAFFKALVDPGPDLIVCDEGHRIKNLKTDVARALSDVKTKRRIVLTGYPLQNNLLEYYCMVDFVRPAYLGSKKQFQLMFDRPIKNGMCIDSTKRDIKIARQRTHVLITMLRGFVQRRTHHLLKKILPDSLEYVVILRKTQIQKNLYKEFVKFIQKELTGEDAAYYNPLKAHAVCSKIWNHPDLLYKAWERQLELLDYTDLANAVDAAEGKILSKQANEQFNNGMEMAAPPTSNYQFNEQFLPTTYNMMTSSQQTMSQFGNGLFTTAGTSMALQQNYPNQWPNQFMTPPPSNQMPGYSPIMQSPTSNFTSITNTPTSSTFEMNGGNLKRKKESSSEASEFDKAAKKKRPGKKKLVQLITDDDEGGSIPYYWADPFMGDYVQGVLENSNKTIIAMKIIRETVKRGEKILLFSTSLLTLSLIEDFLKMHGSIEMDGGVLEWRKNVNYFRFDGSTSAVERERLISQFNSDPNIRLFLISTRAGSLGINLVSASRILIMDCSWNPCHDAQAVCRIYRYGQKNKTYIYRLIMHNCMERSIFARQISKHGLQQRVVDEQLIDANVTQKELENLIAYDEIQDMDVGDVDTSKWKIEDDLLNSIAMEHPKMFSECPFLHESLMLESEDQLSKEEKIEAELLFEREKKGLLHTPNLAPFETPQINYTVGNPMYPQVIPTTYNAFPSYLQPALNRAPQIFPAATYAAPMNRMNYNNQLPATMQHLAVNRMPMTTNPIRTPFHMQMLPPAKSNNRPINKSGHIIQNRRVVVDEDLNLNSVSRPGTKLFVPRGDSVLIVKTATGGYYLRTDYGQIADAGQTKYAQPPAAPHPDEIIELD